MKVTEVSGILLGSIKKSFEKYGFTLNQKKREFKREINGCSQIFDLFFYKKGDFIIIKPEIRIKIAKIENIYKSITSVIERPYLTLGNHLFEIMRYIDKGEEVGMGEKPDWKVIDETDIKKLVEVIPEYLEEILIPYFDENNTVARVDYLLNKYPNELSLHNYLYPLRANIAIIAAKLNQNPKYEELVKLYDKELNEAEKTYKEEFYALKRILM